VCPDVTEHNGITLEFACGESLEEGRVWVLWMNGFHGRLQWGFCRGMHLRFNLPYGFSWLRVAMGVLHA